MVAGFIQLDWGLGRAGGLTAVVFCLGLAACFAKCYIRLWKWETDIYLTFVAVVGGVKRFELIIFLAVARLDIVCVSANHIIKLASHIRNISIRHVRSGQGSSLALCSPLFDSRWCTQRRLQC
jgi:hypothetical protein